MTVSDVVDEAELRQRGGGDRRWRDRLNYWADIVALIGCAVVFGTGLILLLRFHVGDGSLRTASMGAGRLVWVNIHRLAAIPTSVALAIHIQLRWRAIAMRVRRRAARLPGGGRPSDFALYLGSAITPLAAGAAWLAVEGSSPLSGPVLFSHANHARHALIDVHNFSALMFLVAAIIHVRRHLGWILRASGLQLAASTRERSERR